MPRTSWILTVVLIALWVPTVLVAQGSSRFSLAGGVTTSAGIENDAGFHVLGSAHARTPLPGTSIRIDGLYESTQNLVFASGNVVLQPLQARLAPYILGGAGTYVKNDAPLVLNLGLGLGTALLHRPLFLETRIYFLDPRDAAREGRFLTISIGRSL